MTESEPLDKGMIENEVPVQSAMEPEMYKSFKYWTRILLVVGVINILLWPIDRGNPMLSIVFFLCGAAMYFFKVTAMLPVIGILFVWAALGNLLAAVFSDQSFYFLDTVVFLFLGIRTFYDFRKFRNVEAESTSSASEAEGKSRSRLALARRVFPAGGCAITAVSVGAFACVWLGSAFVLGFELDVYYFEIESLMYGLTMTVSVLAIAVSSASILAGYDNKWLAAAGMAAAILALLCQFLLLPIGEM